MASQTLTELETQLIAIKTSFTKMQEQASAAVEAAAKARNGEQLDIAGMRQQIMDNAMVLFPLLESNPKQKGINDNHRVGSEFRIVTIGEGTTISARVVHKMEPIDEGRIIMVNGPHAATQEQALKELLNMTSKMLNKRSDSFFCSTAQHKKIECGGVSYYYSLNG